MPLNDNQRDDLRQTARQAVGHVSERAHFVLMREQGMTSNQIAQIMDYESRTVQRWLSRYDADGIAGLHDLPRSGRPAREKHLGDIVETQAGQPPTVYGYLQTIWTVALLTLHICTRFRVAVSASTIRRTLHAVRFSWHRPKLTPARKADPLRTMRQARLAEVLKAAPDATLIAADECDVHLLAVLRAMWQRVGEQLRLPTPGQNRRRSVFGGLNIRNGQWHYLLTDHKRTADFIAFLTLLLQAYVSGPIFVIVDNASIHASKALLDWLTQHPRLQLVYLPTYSGHELNPVEKVWWRLKQFIAANRNFHSVGDLDAAIHRCCRTFTPDMLLTLTNCQVNRDAQAALQSPTTSFNTADLSPARTFGD
jgi:transposase